MKSVHFEYFKKDAIAGTVTGLMAIPLTVGICLMSNYPILMGFYTVIFACIIGFISYLIRPGNYVGTPGIAAGLSPALAYGVHEFGMDKMPFLIFMTALFQGFVWSFNLQRFILRIVPKYLVEGLLAGVGIKIAINFLPYTYTITENNAPFLNENRIILIMLSFISMALFLILYKKYSNTYSGLPYIITISIGFISMLFVKLPVINVEPIDLTIKFPFPKHFFLNLEDFLILLKMIGFSLMLGTIDVIEQVMSNAAIEKLDPLKRKCDTNNSLLAIWIANLGSSFFGGMTNLDGLAKSSTNAFAGAHTKLSNLFTAGVISLAVIFPGLLAYLPEYTLGVIMLFTSWKMIAGLITIATHYDKYELVLSVICSLLVFKMGIFEGLLISIIFHFLVILIYIVGRNHPIQEFWKHFYPHKELDNI